ncbi:MAG: hypothetical protein WC538_22520 [Thermoanaerobaculia bacterium]|jgi:hypothetical protein
MKRHRLPRLLLAAAIVAAFSSCASAPAGPPDISFRLIWTGSADLNLSVVSPRGEQVDFKTRSVGSGGTLDVDCNVRNNQCPSPMENILWPNHLAPQGEYRFTVADATEQGIAPDSGAWVLEIRVLDRVVKQQSGSTASLRQGAFQESISFRRQVR